MTDPVRTLGRGFIAVLLSVASASAGTSDEAAAPIPRAVHAPIPRAVHADPAISAHAGQL